MIDNDIINAKAEIERYKGVIKLLEKDISDTKNETINDITDRLKYFVLNEDPEINNLKCKDYESYMGGANQFRLQIVKGINNLVEEMTEKKKETGK